jgi:hypothetical protein
MSNFTEYTGVRRWANFLPIRIDVPDSRDSGWEVLGLGFAKVDIFVAEARKRAREMIILVRDTI